MLLYFVVDLFGSVQRYDGGGREDQMYRNDSELVFSPSDLITFMESPFASWMDRLSIEDAASGYEQDPEDSLLVTLQNRGYAHETALLSAFQESHDRVATIETTTRDEATANTLAAMRSGEAIIFQGYLTNPPFAGYTDFLVRVDQPSGLGLYSYEVWDTKLSKKLKPYFAIQLCCYGEMLETIQGTIPEYLTVVLGTNERVPLRTTDYMSYYLSLKVSFLDFQRGFNPKTIPNPVESASWGRWSNTAEQILQKRDHPLRVANITRHQIKALDQAGILTMTALAETDIERVTGIGDDVFRRLKAQAHLQKASETEERPRFDILQSDPDNPTGLALLPTHSDADLYFDIEGFPLIDDGLEYLWGCSYFDETGIRQFQDFWGHDRAGEKTAFEGFLDWAYQRWIDHPQMHIYHYGHYEVAAIRRLMGRHGSREHEVDQLLRNEVFIDLHRIVRHGVVVGEPRYSIKNVEHLYRGRRETDVTGATESIVYYEKWREDPDGATWHNSAVLGAIRNYNIDDCDSTQELVDWLRDQQKINEISYSGRTETIEVPQSDTNEEVQELFARVQAALAAETDSARAEILETLGWLIEFHRREDKPSWWRYFDRMGMTEVDLMDDMDCLAGLSRNRRIPYPPTARSRTRLVYEYNYDADQPFRGAARQFQILGPGDRNVSAHEVDIDRGFISFASSVELPAQMSIIPNDIVRSHPIPLAIRDVVKQVLDAPDEPLAILDFLYRRRPRIASNTSGPIIRDDRDFLDQVIRAVSELQNSYLTIQGPPGAGKTFTAKHVIVDLLRQGKKVGISSNSHKAINNLLAAVADELQDRDQSASLVKVDRNDDPLYSRNNITWLKSGGDAADFLPTLDCLAATAWTFARGDMIGELDTLFIDEAGQVSIANLVAMSRCARNFVLIGDQMQLGQPIQGSHPGESGLSVLEYLLRDHATVPIDLGVFLPVSYRMHPDVCGYISRCFYDGRLSAAEHTRDRFIEIGTSGLVNRSTGIQFISVEHAGNTQASIEEIDVIADVAAELLGTTFHTGDELHPHDVLDWNDILFVAPYNHQVNLLRSRLGDQAKVGSVDKFQGQEAPVVVLSMCASSASEAPRGVEFLFSPNRLNVAISRAKCLAIVVGSSSLVNTPVKNLEQMKMVNAFCDLVNTRR